MKANIVIAAVVGLVIGILVDVFFAATQRIPVLGCLVGPAAFLFGLGLPVAVGALAAAWSASRGVMAAPSGMLDGALAAALAELASRLIGFCAGLSSFLGPRVSSPWLNPGLVPSVESSTRAMFFGVWQIGWLVISLVVAALLGGLGGFLYLARTRR